MLNYITKHFKTGDYLYLETAGNTVAGRIVAIKKDGLALETDRGTALVYEKEITGIKYFEPSSVVATYIMKVFPCEEHPDRFFGTDARHLFLCTLSGGEARLSGEKNFQSLVGHYDFPDIVVAKGQCYNVSVVEGFNEDFRSDGITAVKLPYRCKEIGYKGFHDFSALQTAYLPSTLINIGGGCIGGLSSCRLLDFQGNSLNFEWDEQE